MLDSGRLHHSKIACLRKMAFYESWINYSNLQIILQGTKWNMQNQKQICSWDYEKGMGSFPLKKKKKIISVVGTTRGEREKKKDKTCPWTKQAINGWQMYSPRGKQNLLMLILTRQFSLKFQNRSPQIKLFQKNGGSSWRYHKFCCWRIFSLGTILAECARSSHLLSTENKIAT